MKGIHTFISKRTSLLAKHTNDWEKLDEECKSHVQRILPKTNLTTHTHTHFTCHFDIHAMHKILSLFFNIFFLSSSLLSLFLFPLSHLLIHQRVPPVPNSDRTTLPWSLLSHNLWLLGYVQIKNLEHGKIPSHTPYCK